MGETKAQDAVERQISIDAPIERVWELVSETGWWIGDGDRSEQSTTRDDEFVVVDDPKHGSWTILQHASESPGYVSYRCATEPGKRPGEGSSTLVEFFLTEREGGTDLRVVESGFASLDVPPEDRAKAIEENGEGWEMQLGVAKRESAGAAA